MARLGDDNLEGGSQIGVEILSWEGAVGGAPLKANNVSLTGKGPKRCLDVEGILWWSCEGGRWVYIIIGEREGGAREVGGTMDQLETLGVSQREESNGVGWI